MSYRETLVKLGDETEAKVLNLYRLMLDGQLTRDETLALMTAIIGKANARAVVLADASLAATLMLETRAPVPALGLVAEQDQTAVRQAVGTVLTAATTTPDPEGRIGRLARSAPYYAASKAYSDGISKAKGVSGWVRDLEPGACQMCRWWYRGGRVWPKSHPMPTHTGCTCSPRPVISNDITETGFTRSLERNLP